MSGPEKPLNCLDMTPRLMDAFVRAQILSQAMLEEETIREEVIRVLRGQGYTVTPPLP